MRFLLLATIFIAAGATAQERPIVRAEITPETVAVGEPIALTVTILVPTWFTRPPIYPSFELANAITRLPDDSSYSTRERVGRDSWSGIVRTYEVLPLFGASYRLSGQSISISYANPGSDPVIVDVEIPEVIFRGAVPAGAEILDPYIAGRSLKLNLSVEGDVADLEIGDALVVRYQAELDGLPSIFLPPLVPAMSLDGVSIYADSPELSDAAFARRSEKITLVFEAGGEFVIPGMTLGFWNSETESVDVATADGFTVSVTGAVAVPLGSEAAGERNWVFWISIAAGLASLFCLITIYGPGATARYRTRLEQQRASEPYAFAKLQVALKANHPEDAYRAGLVWLKRLNPELTMRQMARSYGDASLLGAVDELSMALFAGMDNDIDTGKLADAIALARSRYLSQSLLGVDNALPPLNP